MSSTIIISIVHTENEGASSTYLGANQKYINSKMRSIFP